MAKRGQGEGTISKRMINGVWDGTWWARITVGKDANGKQKRRAFYGKTRKEVQEKLTAALNDINNNAYIEPSKKRVFTPEEQAAFIEVSKESYHGEMFILALATGLRLGELLALTWEDIDYEKSFLRIDKSLAGNHKRESKSEPTLIVVTPKTKSSVRTVPLLPNIIELLKQREKKQNEFKLAYGKDYHDNGLIFCTENGKPLFGSSVARIFKRLAKMIGVTDMSCHDLRHPYVKHTLKFLLNNYTYLLALTKSSNFQHISI